VQFNGFSSCWAGEHRFDEIRADEMDRAGHHSLNLRPLLRAQGFTCVLNSASDTIGCPICGASTRAGARKD
jgi:hypothetical protein